MLNRLICLFYGHEMEMIVKTEDGQTEACERCGKEITSVFYPSLSDNQLPPMVKALLLEAEEREKALQIKEFANVNFSIINKYERVAF